MIVDSGPRVNNYKRYMSETYIIPSKYIYNVGRKKHIVSIYSATERKR